MKITIFVSILWILFCFPLFSQQNKWNYYYYHGEKIFLQQSINKILVKFVQNADKEHVRVLINGNRSLQLMQGENVDNDVLDFAVLEANNEKETLSFDIIESLKASSIVISATPLLLYDEHLIGLTDEFVVKLESTTSYNELQKIAEQNNCFVKQEDQFVKNQFMISVSKNSKLNSMEMSKLFFETGFFEFSEPNFIVFNAFSSNDAYFDQQWALKNTGQNGGTNGIDVKAEQAWPIATGTNTKVAVVDMGVDLTHPDLQANLLPGYDATGNNSGGAPIWIAEKHGTSCAGIIGAIKDNGIGISGIAPNCKIIPIHASRMDRTFVVLYNTDAANSINWAWQNGADVISNSWQLFPPSQSVTNAINAAVTQGRNGKGCVAVFASGNDNASTVNYPANLPSVIAVGAISPCGERKSPSSCDGETTWGSNYGQDIDVIAPGVLIPTTDMQGSYGYNNGSYHNTFNGTSAAGPHVSGVAALILSVNPSLTSKQVQDIIEQTAQKIGNYNYTSSTAHPNGTWNNEMGYGLVNAYEAVKMAEETLCPPILTGTQPPPTSNYRHVKCEEIHVQDATVPANTTLILNATNKTTINPGFKVEDGASFIIK